MDLRKKIGPLPLWVWLALGAVIGFVLYRRAQASRNIGGSQVTFTPATSQQVLPSTASNGALGTATQAGAPTDTGQTTQDFLQALGAENSNLISAITTLQGSAMSLAASQIAAAQTQTSLGSFNTQTQPVAGVEPNSNTPQIIYVQPQVVTGSNQTPPTTVSTGTNTAGPSVISRYYTYKRDVPLGPGQTVHFMSGRGYYAA